MKIKYLSSILCVAILLFSTYSFATNLPSSDSTLDSILLEVNHDHPDDFAQLTQADLDIVKDTNNAAFKAVYANTRFFIASYWSTERPLSIAQKIQLIYFFQGLKDYALPRYTMLGIEHNVSQNTMVNFCRYTTGEGDTSVYGGYLFNGRWANAAEDFDTAMDAAFAIYSGARTAAQLASQGVMQTAKNLMKDRLQDISCNYLRDHVPAPAREATSRVCGHATDSNVAEGVIKSILFDYILGAYTTALRGMSEQIQGAARINIHYANMALQRCVMAGNGSEGIVSIVTPAR